MCDTVENIQENLEGKREQACMLINEQVDDLLKEVYYLGEKLAEVQHENITWNVSPSKVEDLTSRLAIIQKGMFKLMHLASENQTYARVDMVIDKEAGQ